jgi:FlaA1/EpsC-like NDP-sugar epimerase
MENIDTCFNFAALKHVWACQSQPLEALKTNVIGVQNAIDCAIECNIKTFVQMSTDKVVNPTCSYGKTKALAEDLVLNAHLYQGNNRTRFLVVRSGNVLGSSGSVLEIWQSQKEQGLPLTVTDLNATRYGATREQIVNAILKAVTSDLNGLVVLNMKEYSIKELLAQFGNCDIVETGLKPYEKLHEELWREGENFQLLEVE